ncbi:hypothetical protein nbrc107696_40770 [Gordonia spumicola]|uniref:Uncharacterized protein n=1 Tax=Gordonia spumicola TaxID=589161 RepID=A0A7I9VEP2_9ACTN|nr:hypothetical protein nbrc107696_40770 [Gordonia spumicola]
MSRTPIDRRQTRALPLQYPWRARRGTSTVTVPAANRTIAAHANPAIRSADVSRDARSVSGTHAVPQGLCGSHWFTVVSAIVF